MARIMIADDDPHIREVVTFALENAGHQVTVREDGRTALESALAEQPDLVVLDIMMPDLDGSELAASFKDDRLLGDVPILFMTALVEGNECGERGGQTYLSKSASVEHLIACIEQ